MSNRVNLKLDVTKASIKNPLITVRQGDGEFETLRATVTANGELLDLQGFTITFMGTTAGKHKIVDGNVTIVEASKGVFEYTPSKAWGMDVGGFKIAYFKFVSGDGSTSSANFQVEVIEAVDLTQEEAQNYISVVDATIYEIDKHLNDSLANATQSIAATSSAASSLAVNVSSVTSSAVDQINNTTSSAVYNVNDVASNAVNNVNSTASRVVDNVNNTASNAVNNVNVATSNAANSITSSVTSLGNRIDDYNNKLADVKVGGRNLLVGTKNLQGEGWRFFGSDFNQSDFQGLTSFSTNKAFYGPKYYNSILEKQDKIVSTSTQYVLSAWVNNTGSSPVDVIFYSTGGSGTLPEVIPSDYVVANIPANSGWVRIVSKPFKFTKTTGLTYTIRFENVSDIKDGVFKQAGLKLEMGNVPTDWTPAPEDAPSNDAQLVHKTGTETIAGDKTFTGNTTLSTTTILSGNYGLRFTASGIQKTTDGKNWVSANI